MKYLYSFEEINFGSIIINCDHPPDRNEIIDFIMNGDTYYHDTEFGDIHLIETENSTSKRERISKY